jgi:hypothetical protein
MPIKKTGRKVPKKAAKKRGSGLLSYQRLVKKATLTTTKKILDLERKIKALKAEKAKKVKAVRKKIKK